MQVAAPAVSPQQGHGHMGVGVDQAGQHDFVGAVDHPVKLPGGAGVARIGDFSALHRHKAVLQLRQGRVHGQSGHVFK